MSQNLLNYLNSIYPLSDILKDKLANTLRSQEFKKKSILLREGQTCNYIYFIEQGLVRSYYLKEGDVIISVNSFFKRTPSYEYIQAIEDTIVYFIHHDELQYLYKEFIEFNIIGQILTEKYYMLSEQRLFSIRNQKINERFTSLIEIFPEIIKRVPKKYIASYLGMSAESLSRIKIR